MTETITVPAAELTEQADVVLLLSNEEADALLDLTDYVGGSPEETRRGLIQDMRRALIGIGVTGTRPAGKFDVPDIYITEDGLFFSAVSG